MKGKKCVEKHRTKTIKESLQPKYMEMLKFKSSPAGCLIQVQIMFIFDVLIRLTYVNTFENINGFWKND